MQWAGVKESQLSSTQQHLYRAMNATVTLEAVGEDEMIFEDLTSHRDVNFKKPGEASIALSSLEALSKRTIRQASNVTETLQNVAPLYHQWK